MSTITLALLLFAGAVSAQRGRGSSGGSEFFLDSIDTGRLVVFSIHALVYLILVPLTFVALIKRRGHRGAFLVLLISLVLNTLTALVEIVKIVIAGHFEYIPPAGLSTALYAIVFFASSWSVPLLFLALVLLLHGRFTAVATALGAGKPIVRLPGYRVFPTAHGTIAISLFALGTATAALLTRYRDILARGLPTSRRQMENLLNNEENIRYAYIAIWALSAIDLAVLAVLVQQTLRRLTFHDKVVKFFLIAVVPVYIVTVLNDIIFTIVFSPSGMNGTIDDFRRALLANLVLAGGLYLAIYATAVVLGLRSRLWDINVTYATPVPYNTTPYPQQYQQYNYYSPQPYRTG